MKITILDDYQQAIKNLDCFELIKPYQVDILNYHENNPEVLASIIGEASIIVLTRERTLISEELLALLPNLKLISQTGKISSHINLDVCSKYKVAVAEGIGSSVAPAELTWALLLNTVRKIPQAIEGMKKGHWQTNIGNTVHGKTIGIWGYGKIGQIIAQYAKVFGANVLVWGGEESRKKAVDDGFESSESQADFFKEADIISLHLRLNEKTTGIVKESDLMSMKDNAVLINTARAELIEKNALINTLKRGKNIFIGVDVYEEEPVLDKNYELFKMDNVVCTPHLGYVELNSYELYFGKAFENIVNYINGNPTNIANPQVLTA